MIYYDRYYNMILPKEKKCGLIFWLTNIVRVLLRRKICKTLMKVKFLFISGLESESVQWRKAGEYYPDFTCGQAKGTINE